MAMKQEANTLMILTIGAISGLMVLVLYFGVEAWFRFEEKGELQMQWDHNPNVWLDTLRATQRAHLANVDAAIPKVIANGGKTPIVQ